MARARGLDHAAILAAYREDGASVRDVAARFGCAAPSVLYIVHKAGQSLIRASKREVREREVLRLYARGVTVAEIAERLRIRPKSVSTIAGRLRKAGHDLPHAPKPGRPRTHDWHAIARLYRADKPIAEIAAEIGASVSGVRDALTIMRRNEWDLGPRRAAFRGQPGPQAFASRDTAGRFIPTERAPAHPAPASVVGTSPVRCGGQRTKGEGVAAPSAPITTTDVNHGVHAPTLHGDLR